MLKILKISFRLFLRATILNLVLLGLIFILSIAQNIVESTSILIIRFPVELNISALFLLNLVYLFGNTMEIFYLRLWNKKIELLDFEQKFFNAGLAITFIVLAFGIISYFIG